MEMKKKTNKKRGLAALLITGALVGAGVGATHIVKKVAAQKAKNDEMKRLKELEDEVFDNLFED